MLTYFMLPNRVIFGADASKRAGKEAAKMGMKRPLLVTDPGLRECGIAAGVVSALKNAGLEVTVFSDVIANPNDVCVGAGIEVYSESDADGLVALGGGSAMDTAKAIGLMKTHPAPLAQYDGAVGGMARIHDRLPPLIAIPTTAGTGSEVSSFAVITDTSKKMKLAMGSPFLIPPLALVDPALTLGLPPEVTVNTGVDALTHLVEGYVSSLKNPLADRMALYGLELIGGYLRSVVVDPTDLEGRSNVMMASMTGALVYNQKFLGMNHSMAHALSAVSGMAHGLANGLVLPTTMRFNRPSAPDQYAEVGHALGGTDAVAEVESLLDDVGMTLGLRNHGIARDDIGTLATKAFEDPSHGTNPRQPITREDFEKLFREAY